MADSKTNSNTKFDTNAYYAIISLYSGQVMTVKEGKDSEGKDKVWVVQSTFTNSDDQVWKFIPDEDSYKMQVPLREKYYLRCDPGIQELYMDTITEGGVFRWDVNPCKFDVKVYREDKVTVDGFEITSNHTFPTVDNFDQNKHIRNIPEDKQRPLQQHWYLIPQPSKSRLNSQ